MVPEMASNRNSSVTKTESAEGQITRATPFQSMIRQMGMTAEMEANESKFSGDDLNALLTAETEAEIWDADERGPLNFQHLADCEIQIVDISVKYSRAGQNGDMVSHFVTDDGKKMYLLVTGVRISNAGEKTVLRLPGVGEEFQANTSARYVVAKLWAFYQKGYIDPDNGKRLECVVKATDLGDGQAVIKIRPMPRRVQSTIAAE
jgi:hypothetical protein